MINAHGNRTVKAEMAGGRAWREAWLMSDGAKFSHVEQHNVITQRPRASVGEQTDHHSLEQQTWTSRYTWPTLRLVELHSIATMWHWHRTPHLACSNNSRPGAAGNTASQPASLPGICLSASHAHITHSRTARLARFFKALGSLLWNASVSRSALNVAAGPSDRPSERVCYVCVSAGLSRQPAAQFKVTRGRRLATATGPDCLC